MKILTTLLSYCGEGCDPNEEKRLLQAFNHFESNGMMSHHTLITTLVHCFNHWLNLPEDKFTKIASIMTSHFSFCLVWDDLLDNTSVRQGIPTAHLVYGCPSTLYSLNYGKYLLLKQIIDLGKPELVDAFLDHSLKAHRAQSFEIYWINNIKCPTIDEYLELCLPKTSSYFSMTFDLMQVFSENKEDLRAGVTEIGNLFQLTNDYLNVQSTKYSRAKPSFADDITSGTFTLPIIHAIQSKPHDDQVITILRRKSSHYEVKKYCVSLLKEFGSIDYTRKEIRKKIDKIIDEFKRFPKNQLLEENLEMVLEQLKPETQVNQCFML